MKQKWNKNQTDKTMAECHTFSKYLLSVSVFLYLQTCNTVRCPAPACGTFWVEMVYPVKASQVPNVLPVILNCVLVTIFQDLFFLPASGELHRWWPIFLHLNSQFLICWCQIFYFLNIFNHKHFPMSPLSLVFCSLTTLTSPPDSMRALLQGINLNCHGEQTSGGQ